MIKGLAKHTRQPSKFASQKAKKRNFQKSKSKVPMKNLKTGVLSQKKTFC